MNFPLSQIHFAINLYLRACRSGVTCISEDVVNRVFELPAGYGEHLRARLAREIRGTNHLSEKANQNQD
jgi:hypothetical protein